MLLSFSLLLSLITHKCITLSRFIYKTQNCGVKTSFLLKTVVVDFCLHFFSTFFALKYANLNHRGTEALNFSIFLIPTNNRFDFSSVLS